jgi:predicted PurR-regulated permease PerM
MDRRVIAPFIACVLLALLAYLVYQLFRPFLGAIGFGAVLTVVTYPLYERLRRKLGRREGAAAGLMVLTVVLLLVVPAVSLIAALGAEAKDVYHWLQKAVTQENPFQVLLDRLDAYRDRPILGWLAEKIRPQLEAFAADARTTVPEGIRKVVGFVTTLFTSILANVAAFLVNLILSLATMGILYTRGEQLLAEAAVLAPLPPERSRELFSRLGEVMKAVVKGVGLTCMAQGALGGVGFWVAGLPSPLLFGTVMAFTSLIPLVGTAIVWLPGVLYLFLTGKTVFGVGLLLWSVVVVGNIDNVLRPLLIGGKAGMPLPLLIVGILGGLFSYGLLGLLIGPAVLTVLLFALEENRRGAADAGKDAPPPVPEPSRERGEEAGKE